MANSYGGQSTNPQVMKQEMFNENRRMVMEIMH